MRGLIHKKRSEEKGVYYHNAKSVINNTNFVLRGYKYTSVVFILVNFIGWSKQALMVATNVKMAPLW